jgi:hypothetical protein
LYRVALVLIGRATNDPAILTAISLRDVPALISLAMLPICSSPPEAQCNCDTCYQGLPPKQSRPNSTYGAEVENGSDNQAVILPEIAVPPGNLNQIRMCCIPI